VLARRAALAHPRLGAGGPCARLADGLVVRFSGRDGFSWSDPSRRVSVRELGC